MKSKRIEIAAISCLFILGGIFYSVKNSEHSEQVSTNNKENIIHWNYDEMPEVTGVNWLHDNEWLALSWKQEDKSENEKVGTRNVVYRTSTPIVGLNKVVLVESEWHLSEKSDDQDRTSKFLIDIYTVGKQGGMNKEKRVDLLENVKKFN